MGVALLAAARSKDARKRNGACIVSPDNKISGVGYNGLPRGCDDSDPHYWQDDDSDPLNSRSSGKRSSKRPSPETSGIRGAGVAGCSQSKARVPHIASGATPSSVSAAGLA